MRLLGMCTHANLLACNIRTHNAAFIHFTFQALLGLIYIYLLVLYRLSDQQSETADYWGIL